MNHKVKLIKNLMYNGCEAHYKCINCGEAWPLRCWPKHIIESRLCEDGGFIRLTDKERELLK